MAGAWRLELQTYGFGDRRSTNWAIPLPEWRGITFLGFYQGLKWKIAERTLVEHFSMVRHGWGRGWGLSYQKIGEFSSRTQESIRLSPYQWTANIRLGYTHSLYTSVQIIWVEYKVALTGWVRSLVISVGQSSRSLGFVSTLRKNLGIAEQTCKPHPNADLEEILIGIKEAGFWYGRHQSYFSG